MKSIIITVLIISNSFAQIIDSLQFIQNANDTTINSDTTYIAPNDSLFILKISELDENSFSISREKIIKSNYRFAGDLLNDFPLSFQRDYGFVGYPNEILLYGIGSPFVNWMSDGISLNDRFNNSYNLNLIQTEDIDSIEVVPLTRGFLYGSYMYPVTVNFITRDFIPKQPYSRIRYIQGPNREASVDANFHALVSKKFLFSFDITNRIKDSTFRNTEFSIWQIKTRLKYFLSDEINLIASYNYNDYKIGFNGGIDIDSIESLTTDINSILYDEFLAPVNLPDDKIKTLQHFPRLSLLTNFFTWLKSDVNVFYRFSRVNRKDIFFDLTEEKVLGFSFNNKVFLKNFEFKLFVDYENQRQSARIRDDIIILPIFDTYVLSNTFNVLSFGGILTSKLLQDKMNISLFYKYSDLKKNFGREIFYSGTDITISSFGYSTNPTNSGMGFDLSFRFNDNLKFYAGGSFFDEYSISSTNKEPLLFQSGLSFSNDFLNTDLYYVYNEYLVHSSANYHKQADRVNGLALSLKTKFNFILLESQNTFYDSPSGSELYFVPDFSSRTGLYYNDFLFDNNLDLKAGFIFTYVGKQNFSSVETRIIKVPSVSRLDFSLAGEVRKAAIVYFIIENIFDKKYYLTPYYPMPERNFRFGIAWEFLN
ncbi:MAG: TonB-dependent receptor [Ignavibacterium album]|uniref:TonB-dependent receptor plug domain-containing protein n=1 Tax=Ignavibacterium album TaxID=591197 RepID=UPI0026F0C25A|nr:putative porin [Ignavibacterium album]MBI5661877.1 TonB-dependent receptor [Ignavibacterium album]